jgi:hypothetical protein
VLNNNAKGLKKLFLAAAAVVASYSFAPTSQAALLVDFKPEPTSATLPEIVFTGSALTPGAGSTGNGSVLTAGGLTIETPYTVNVPGAGGFINLASGSTSFQDVSLVLAGLNATGPATSTTIAPGVVLLNQALTGAPGSFTLRSTSDAPNQVDLLTGTITRAFITGLQGSPTGSVISAEVVYTGGEIFDELIANGGLPNGSLSFSLNDIGSTLGAPTGLTLATGGGLAPFQANATGIFSSSVVPEPGTIGLLAIGGLILTARRRK